MRTRPRFKDRMMQNCYATARHIAADNWSEFFHNRTTAGPTLFGPFQPRRGAGIRCAYWDGWFGTLSLYAKDRKSIGYAYWAAGQDNRRRAHDLAIIHATMQELNQRP